MPNLGKTVFFIPFDQSILTVQIDQKIEILFILFFQNTLFLFLYECINNFFVKNQF